MTEKPRLIDPRTYLDLFAHLTSVIAHTHDLSALIKSCVRIIQSVLMVESCSLMLLNSEGTGLTMGASSSIPESLWDRIAVNVGEGIAGQVAATGKPIRAQGFGEPDRCSGGFARKYHTKSYISVPLLGGEFVMGVVNVTDRVDRAEFSTFDQEMLQAIAEMIACAITHHRLWTATQKSYEHLSQVIEELPVGMLTIASDGTLTLCNKSAKRYLNLPWDIPLDKQWRDHVPQPTRNHLALILVQMEQGRNAYIEEFEIADEPPSEIPRSVRISAILAEHPARPQARQIIFFVEDLQQMKELVDLRRSDQMKSNFLSLISHELRTPLASIKGAIHLLNQMDEKEFREGADRIFALLHRNIDRLAGLVNNILDAMDLDTHSLRLYRKRSDLRALVDKVVKKMQSGCGEKAVFWDVALESTSTTIYVDENRLGQVVEHLLENALKFTPANGKITVRTSSAGGQWRLRVANTGRAIDPSLHERIFSRFYQVDGTLTRYYGGSGLGLYLCREIVRLHGGDIRIDPDSEEGACFEVTIPEVAELV